MYFQKRATITLADITKVQLFKKKFLLAIYYTVSIWLALYISHEKAKAKQSNICIYPKT